MVSGHQIGDHVDVVAVEHLGHLLDQVAAVAEHDALGAQGADRSAFPALVTA